MQVAVSRVALAIAAASGFLVLAGCAASPVKPLYGFETARLGSIEVHMVVQEDGVFVEQTFAETDASPSGAHGNAGIVGTAIAGAVIGFIADSPARKEAQELRVKVAPLAQQMAGFDYSSLLQKGIERALRGHQERTVLIRSRDLLQEPEKIRFASAANSDSTLFIDVGWAIARPAFAPISGSAYADGPPQLRVRASLLLLDRAGRVLVRDTILFEPPVANSPSVDDRVRWWKETDRYRRLLELSAPALGFALAEVLFGTKDFANEIEFNAQRSTDSKVRPGQRLARLRPTLERFKDCEGFHRIAAADTKFETYRDLAEGPLYVGLICPAAPRF